MSFSYTAGCLTEKAKLLFDWEREKKELTGWFLIQEKICALEGEYVDSSDEMRRAQILNEIASFLPLEITENHVFAGTQADAFARSYALINPSFKVEQFSGYCDPTAVFNDIKPTEEFSQERIDTVRQYVRNTPYVKDLTTVYKSIESETAEVVFFVEQVTGHMIPDFRYVLKYGVKKMISDLALKKGKNYEAFATALQSVLILAERYRTLALHQAETAEPNRREELYYMAETLHKVPAYGASNLFEAIQAYILLWQVMCIEQSPNPFAFSIGNVDRVFEPYRNNLSRLESAALFKHFLVFFNVGDRSWAISQNMLLGGKDENNADLTNESTYALLDAFYDMNLPQPILSMKLHKNTPKKLYEELGKFFFTSGTLTPSLFNDDSLSEILIENGCDIQDVKDIAVAGCQEPLIMGKDNGNTTNSWLNLPKILEITLTGGMSAISGKRIADLQPCKLENIREEFYKNTVRFSEQMAYAANGAAKALSHLKVPFLSAFMGGMETGIDVRDVQEQGTKYNGSGCLIHGPSIVSDSFIAIDSLLKNRAEDKDKLVPAMQNDFVNFEDLRNYLLSCNKFGNNIPDADNEAADVISKSADIVSNLKNYLGNPFRPDFSSPSTHLLYGYWVGATPDGRKAREMLSYGIDPLFGEATNGLGFRVLSTLKLPFEKMPGGYASHLGIDPKYFSAKTMEEKGYQFYERIVAPLFFNDQVSGKSPFYLYVNVTSPETLRKLQANPKKYAPSGIYIMRIHGTFVNFLNLSPAIQEDIIKRLDQKSTILSA